MCWLCMQGHSKLFIMEVNLYYSRNEYGSLTPKKGGVNAVRVYKPIECYSSSSPTALSRCGQRRAILTGNLGRTLVRDFLWESTMISLP